MRIIPFGIGKKYREIIKDLKKYAEIVCLADNDEGKLGTFIDGYIVISSSEIEKYYYDAIIITTRKFEAEIREQLIEQGIAADKIFSANNFPADIFGFREARCYYRTVPCKNTNRRALLFSHELSRTGAPIALLNMAKVLKKNNYELTIWTTGKDDGLTDFFQNDIEICIFNFLELDACLISRIQKYDLIVVNTSVLYKVIEKVPDSIPCLWWIHEEEHGYPFIPKGLTIRGNVCLIGASDRCSNSVTEYTGKDCRVLHPYVAVKKNRHYEIRKENSRIKFITIGFGTRKGTDILLDVIRHNYSKWKDEAEFCFAGYGGERYEMCEGASDLGYMDQLQIEELYNSADVIICPSRYETMSMSVIQAWANSITCIASDTGGASEYIDHKKNGLIFRSEDIDDLAYCIQWVIDNKDKIKHMGELGYKIYSKYFTEEVFEKDFKEILDELMG